jgi:hypothetical protein
MLACVHDRRGRGEQMTSYDGLNDRIHALQLARFEQFEHELVRCRALAKRDAKLQKERTRRQLDFATAIGLDADKFSRAARDENRSQETALKAFLEEFRPEVAGRRPAGAAVAEDAAIRSAVLAEAGALVLPAFASSIVVPEISRLADIDGLDWTTGELDSGWVFPDDPSHIRIMDSRHYANALCWDNRPDPPPEFAVYFGFVPASTATYNLNAVLAFHGFYILRCDDSWWNCRDAEVTLTVQMNVHQYTDSGWTDFTVLDVETANADEVTSYDRTQFFDCNAALRAGDPVVVTVKGVVHASAHGGGAYAELNFADGTANYIQPLFLAVAPG